MEKYVIGDTIELELSLPFDLPEEFLAGVPIMKIKEGTKIRNITGFVHRAFQVSYGIPRRKTILSSVLTTHR